MKSLAMISTLLVTLTTLGMFGESQQCVDLRKEFNWQVSSLDDTYRLASCEALAGNRDLAFIYLFMVKDKGFDDVDGLLADVSFDSLHQDSRWQGLVNHVAAVQQQKLVEGQTNSEGITKIKAKKRASFAVITKGNSTSY